MNSRQGNARATRFRLAVVVFCACTVLNGCTLRSPGAKPADAGEGAKILAFECRDVVAIGRIATLHYAEIEDSDDLLGHGLFTMRVTIRRVLRGREVRKIVTASQISHGQLVENRDFVMRLTPKEDGSYVLTSAALWHSRYRPTIPAQCTAGETKRDARWSAGRAEPAGNPAKLYL